VPVVLVGWLLFEQSDPATLTGIALAIVSGAITSALGYAAWYAILPGLGASRAALAQLSVPVIALVFGAILLGEIITLKAVLASILVLGGILLGILRPGAKA
jgi:drug/metabolite transporter (DMT)-like permease